MELKLNFFILVIILLHQHFMISQKKTKDMWIKMLLVVGKMKDQTADLTIKISVGLKPRLF